MLEDDTGVVLECKRRLPVWMLAAGASDKVSKSENEGTQQSEPSRPSKRRETKSKEDVFVQERDVVKPERPKRTRRSSKNVADSGFSSNETKLLDEDLKKNSGYNLKVVKKKNTAPRAKKKQKVDLQECGGAGDRIEDGVELTVDDLISIAQEYVGGAESADDVETKQPEISAKESTSKALNSTSFLSSSATPGSSFSEAGTRNGISKCIMSSLPETKCMDEIPEDNIPINKVTTGDAAQDMLDLFLGPLLKKTDNTEAPKSETNIGEELRFGIESSEQVGSSVGCGKPEVHVAKKKTSLKDKVAMFLA